MSEVGVAADFTVREILSAVKGRLCWGEPTMEVAGVSTDSRTIGPGELFVPVAGPHFDGHDFLKAALEANAAGVLVQAGRKVSEEEDAFAIEVSDSLRALGDLARYHRSAFEIPVVVVTGSNGKTTTKEMIGAILAQGGETLKSEGNLNNLVGLPLQIFKMGPEHEKAVLEMGMNQPGEIFRLTEIAAPQVAVITNIAPVHLEGLGSVEAVRDAKGEALEAMSRGGCAVLCGDDPHCLSLARRYQDAGGKVVLFGFSGECDVRAKDIKISAREGINFIIQMNDQERKITLSAVGRHNVLNALAAAASSSLLGCSLDEVIRGLACATVPRMRLEIEDIPAKRRCYLLNDAYNANPVSVHLALETAAELKGPGRLFGVLGDMKELGAFAESAHREVGRAAASVKAGVDFFVGVGPLMALAAEAARKAGMPKEKVRHFNNPEDAGVWVAEQLRLGDWVLVKGSRSMQMERTIEALRG